MRERLPLDDALDLLFLIAAEKPERLPAAVMRWHGRLELEVSTLTLEEAQLALADLRDGGGAGAAAAAAAEREADTAAADGLAGPTASASLRTSGQLTFGRDEPRACSEHRRWSQPEALRKRVHVLPVNVVVALVGVPKQLELRRDGKRLPLAESPRTPRCSRGHRYTLPSRLACQPSPSSSKLSGWPSTRRPRASTSTMLEGHSASSRSNSERRAQTRPADRGSRIARSVDRRCGVTSRHIGAEAGSREAPNNCGAASCAGFSVAVLS